MEQGECSEKREQSDNVAGSENSSARSEDGEKAADSTSVDQKEQREKQAGL